MHAACSSSLTAHTVLRRANTPVDTRCAAHIGRREFVGIVPIAFGIARTPLASARNMATSAAKTVLVPVANGTEEMEVREWWLQSLSHSVGTQRDLGYVPHWLWVSLV